MHPISIGCGEVGAKYMKANPKINNIILKIKRSNIKLNNLINSKIRRKEEIKYGTKKTCTKFCGSGHLENSCVLYGMQEFYIQDCNGYILGFAERK